MATNASLTGGCLAFWKMDEASGTRVDSVGSFNLSESGGPVTSSNFTPQFQPGVLTGPVALLTGSPAQGLERTNATDLHMADVAFTVTCWFQINTVSGSLSTQCFVGKYNAETSGLNWCLQYGQPSGGLQFAYGTGTDSAGANVIAASIPNSGNTGIDYLALPSPRWYFLVGRRGVGGAPQVACWGGGANQPNLQGTWYYGPTPTGSMVSSTSRFCVGARDSSAGAISAPFFGKIGNVGIWNRCLTDGDVGNLWNGGYGLDYPFGYPA